MSDPRRDSFSPPANAGDNRHRGARWPEVISLLWRQPQVGQPCPTRAPSHALPIDPSATPIVGIFGKHPAWPDHIALPLGSAALRELRTRLYDGFRTAIANGSWEPSTREGLILFDHLFCACGLGGDSGWIVGRVWDSSDAVGRREYPMVACIHVFTADCHSAMSISEPLLNALEHACRIATTQAQVMTAVDEARSNSAAAARLLPSAPVPMRPPTPAPAHQDSAQAAAVSWEWLAKLMLALTTAWRQFLARNRPRRIKGVRLSARASSPGAALCPRATTAARRLSQRAPVFAACAGDAAWVDLTVGTLTPLAVARLRLAPSPAA